MQINTVDLDTAFNKAKLIEAGYRYAWVQSISSTELGKIEEVTLNRENLLEARVFCEEKELHLFYYDNQLSAVEVVKETNDHYIQERQLLRKKFGTSITLRNYIGYDCEDSQAYISHTVFCDYEGR